MYASSFSCSLHSTRWRLYPRCPEEGYPSRWRRTQCDDDFSPSTFLNDDGDGDRQRSSVPKRASRPMTSYMQAVADSECATNAAHHVSKCTDEDNDRENMPLKKRTDTMTEEKGDALAALYKAYRNFDGETGVCSIARAAHPPLADSSTGLSVGRPTFPSPYVPLTRRGGGALRHKQIDRPLTAPSPQSLCREEEANATDPSRPPADSFYQRAQHVLLDALDFALTSQVLLSEDVAVRVSCDCEQVSCDSDAGRTGRTPTQPLTFTGNFCTTDAGAEVREYLEQQEAADRDLLSFRLLSDSLSSAIVPNFAAFELMARHAIVSSWMDRVENELYWRSEALCLEAREEQERTGHVAVALLSTHAFAVVEGLAEPRSRGAIVIEEEECRCELIRRVADRVVHVFVGENGQQRDAVPLYESHPSAVGELLAELAKKALIEALLRESAFEEPSNSGEHEKDEVGEGTGPRFQAKREGYRALLETLDDEDLVNVRRALALSTSEKSAQMNTDTSKANLGLTKEYVCPHQLSSSDQAVDGNFQQVGERQNAEEKQSPFENNTVEEIASTSHHDTLAACDDLEDGGERPNSADDGGLPAYHKGPCHFGGNTDTNASSTSSSPLSSRASVPDPTLDLLSSAEADPDVESSRTTHTKASTSASPKKARKESFVDGSHTEKVLMKPDIEMGQPERCEIMSNFEQTRALGSFEGEKWDVEGSHFISGLHEITTHSRGHPPSASIDIRGDASSPRTVATQTSPKVGDALLSTPKPPPFKRGQGTDNSGANATDAPCAPVSPSYRKQWHAYMYTATHPPQDSPWSPIPTVDEGKAEAKGPKGYPASTHDALPCLQTNAGRRIESGRGHNEEAVSVSRSVSAGLRLAKARMSTRAATCDTSTTISKPLSNTRRDFRGHEAPYPSSHAVYMQALARQHVLRVEALEEAESFERQFIEEMGISQGTTMQDPCTFACTCTVL